MGIAGPANKNGWTVKTDHFHPSAGLEMLSSGDHIDLFTVDPGGTGGTKVGQGDAFPIHPFFRSCGSLGGSGGIEDIFFTQRGFREIAHPEDSEDGAGDEFPDDDEGASWGTEFCKADDGDPEETDYAENAGDHARQEDFGEKEGDPGDQEGEEKSHESVRRTRVVVPS